MKQLGRLGFLALIAALGIIGSTTLPASANPPVGQTWATYKDSRLGFSFKYPMGWKIQMRADNPESISEVLTLTAPVSSESTLMHSISIGQYLYEIKPNEKLSRWMNKYPKQFSTSEIKTFETLNWRVDGAPARYIRGASPLTEYQYTNIRRGSIVWFVWANFADRVDSPHGAIYLQIVRSFKFDRKAPTSLQDIYGTNFQPLSLPVASQDSVLPLTAPEIGSAWWSPVVKPIGGSAYTVNCGSSAHTNGASYAADVSVVTGTRVYAANAGVIEFWGWDNSGYGNLVKINKPSNGYRHYYGHLNEINFAQPSNVSRAAYLGKSGSSGTTTAHLHFHVQNGSNQLTATGIALVGMTGFTSNENYPSVNAACGTMGR